MASVDQPAAVAASGAAEKEMHPEDVTIALEDEPSRPNARPAIFRSTAQEILFIFAATMRVAMPSSLQGSTLVVSSFIRRDLNMTTSQLTWMTANSALTSGSFLLFFGKVADIFGRRGILLTSLFLSASFALATGFSRDALTLNVLNGVMGLTSASTIPSAQDILGSIYDKPSKRKNYALSCFTSGNHLGFVLSSIFSGIATQFFGWPASFWLLAIIYLVVAIIACFTVPMDDSEKLRSCVHHNGCPDDCCLRLLLTILLLGFLSFPALFFFSALYLQELFGYSALTTAVCLLPTAVSGVVVNFIPGQLLHRVSSKLLMGFGAAAFTVYFLFVAVQRSGGLYWAFTFPALAIVVVGTDLEFNVVNMYVVSSLPKSQQSIASSIFQTTIKLAVTIGLGVFAAIFPRVSENPATTGYYAHDPLEPYAALFWFATALSFVSLLLVLFLKIKSQGHE